MPCTFFVSLPKAKKNACPPSHSLWWYRLAYLELSGN